MNDAAEVIALARTAHERTFRTHDGVDLFYRHWPAPKAPHAARSCCSIAATSIRDAWRTSSTSSACRNSTSSPGTRAATAARRARAATHRAFRHWCATCRRSSSTSAHAHGFAMEDIAVVAQSVGAVLVAAWVHDYAPRIRCMVLASPAFKVKLYVPFARPGLALMHKLRGNFFVTSYVKAKFLTRDPARMRELRHRPADRARDLGAHPARPVRRCRAHRRRCGGDRHAHAAPHFRCRLGRASRTAARVLRPAGRDGQGAARAARLLSRHAGRARSRHAGRAHARRSSCAASTAPLAIAGSDRCRPRGLHARGSRRARRAAAAAVAAWPVLGRHARGTALRCDAVGRRSARPRDGIRFRQHARLRLSQCRVGRHAAGTHDRPQLPRCRSAGPASASASCTSRSCCGRRSPTVARKAGPVRIVDIAAGHGRYVLDAIAQGRSNPTRSCCATTASGTSSRATR